jgi:hypothetical protein
MENTNYNSGSYLMSERTSWEEYFKQIVELTASRSSCKRLKVGCLLVRDNRIISQGYNGFLAGCPHKSIVVNNHEQSTVHAEQNALKQIIEERKPKVHLFGHLRFLDYDCSQMLAYQVKKSQEKTSREFHLNIYVTPRELSFNTRVSKVTIHCVLKNIGGYWGYLWEQVGPEVGPTLAFHKRIILYEKELKNIMKCRKYLDMEQMQRQMTLQHSRQTFFDKLYPPNHPSSGRSSAGGSEHRYKTPERQHNIAVMGFR